MKILAVWLVYLGCLSSVVFAQSFEDIKESALAEITERQELAAEQLTKALEGTQSLEYIMLDPSVDRPTRNSAEISAQRLLGWKIAGVRSIVDKSLIQDLREALVADLRDCRRPPDKAEEQRILQLPYHGIKIRRGDQYVVLLVDHIGQFLVMKDGATEYFWNSNSTSSRILYFLNQPSKLSKNSAITDAALKKNLVGKWTHVTSGDKPSPKRIYVKTTDILTLNSDGTYVRSSVNARTAFGKSYDYTASGTMRTPSGKNFDNTAGGNFTGTWDVKNGLLIRKQGSLVERRSWTLADICYDIVSISSGELQLRSCDDLSKNPITLQLTRVLE